MWRNHLQPKYSRIVQVQTAGLFVALIAIGAFISIPLPISPVPIVLQNFFVLLAGLMLPAGWAFLSVTVYLLIGALGMPVFAGGTGGLAHFLGPSGGYLLSYIAVAPAVSILSGRNRSWLLLSLSSVTGVAIMYVCGVPWLARVLELDFHHALMVGALPYLPGDLVKVVLAVLVIRGTPENLWRNLRSHLLR